MLLPSEFLEVFLQRQAADFFDRFRQTEADFERRKMLTMIFLCVKIISKVYSGVHAI